MKRLFSLLFLLLAGVSLAQNTCQTAKPFCAGGVSGDTFPATTSVTTAQTGPNYGCLGSTPNPAWYYLQISNSGNLDILIQGTLTAPPGPGQDVDFICWGPFNSMTGICDSLNLNKIVDCSYSGSFTETLNIPNGVSGQYYLVLITNFANIVQNIQFTQYAGTGSTNCGLLGSNSKICAGQTATIVATNSGSLANATYSMNPGGLSNSTGSFYVTPLVTTVYTLFVTGSNNLSQPATQTAVANVTVNPQPSAAPQVTNTTCTSTVNAFKLNLTFQPPSATPGYTINWNSIPNGIGSAQQQTLTGGINSNNYNATITAAGGCSVTTSLTITPQPEPALIDIQPLGLGYTLTCYEPVLTLTSMVATNNYTWANGINAPITGQFATLTFTNLGTWTVNAVNPLSGCISSRTFALGQNTLTPTNTITPAFQNITCAFSTIQTVTSTASPTVNISHWIYSPFGGTVTVNSNVSNFLPTGPGTYTDCAFNNVNGCPTCRQFTVVANQGYPTFNVVSPQNFTLGCTTKSVATINIANASATDANQNPTGGPVSYTLLAPGSASALPQPTLSSNSSYTVNMPGTWTVVTKDNTTFCETRVPVTILLNTTPPNLFVAMLQQTLTCKDPTVILRGQSVTNNISFNWSYSSFNQASDSISVGIRTATPTGTLVNTYTLTITDNSSTCRSTSVVPVYQNIFKPKVLISSGGSSLTCNTNTIILTNQSETGIVGNFPISAPVVADKWAGPSPQEDVFLSSTYIAATPGVYTMTARDLNNGCTNTGTINIGENRRYPLLQIPVKKQIFACGERIDTLYMDIPNRTAAYTFTWSAGPGIAMVDRNKVPLLATSPGRYKLLVLDPTNGCASSGEVEFFNDSLSAIFELSRKEGFVPMSVSFSNGSTSNSDNSRITSFWNFGNSTYSTTTAAGISPSALYTSPGTYTVKLFAFKGNCNAVATQTLRVDLPSTLIIPNIFTPNNDKVNDVFFLQANNLSEIQMTITDRWGHQVFDLLSHTGNVLWDGKTPAGQDAAEGVYFYTLKAIGTDGENYDQKGTITLMR